MRDGFYSANCGEIKKMFAQVTLMVFEIEKMIIFFEKHVYLNLNEMCERDVLK